MSKRQTTPRGMAELTDFQLRSPDHIAGDITPSLFSGGTCERCGVSTANPLCVDCDAATGTQHVL